MASPFACGMICATISVIILIGLLVVITFVEDNNPLASGALKVGCVLAAGIICFGAVSVLSFSDASAGTPTDGRKYAVNYVYQIVQTYSDTSGDYAIVRTPNGKLEFFQNRQALTVGFYKLQEGSVGKTNTWTPFSTSATKP